MVGIGLSSVASAAIKGSTLFRDVPAGHYADDAIGELADLGIIRGTTSTTFSPDAPITRGQVALLLQRLRNELKGSVGTSSRSSVSSSSSSSSAYSSSSSSSISSSASSSSSSSTAIGPLPYNPGGYVHFGAREYNIDKNDATGLVTIVVARTGGNTGAGTVDYTFNTGTAVADKDYKPLSGTLNFGNKETSKKIQLQIINNAAEIAHKTVELKLKNPTGAIKIDSPDAIVLNIRDPRIPFGTSSSVGASSSAGTSSSVAAATTISLSASGYGVMENGGIVTIGVTRTGATTGVTEISYATGNGTGNAGTEYSSTSGKLTFNAGETSKNFTVSISDNTQIDGSHTFNVNLSNPTNGAALGTSSAVVTINDNETISFGTGSLKFSASSYTVTEGNDARVTINHIGGLLPVSVNFTTNGGSALAGSDYTAVNTTVSFAQGETSKVVLIPIAKDSVTDGGETINISLQTPTNGASISDPSFATVTINE